MAISRQAREILNRPELIGMRDMWFSRMEKVFAGETAGWNGENVLAVNGIVGSGSHDPYTEPERWMEDCLEDLARRYAALENPAYFRPLCVEYGIYGVHYVDKILGAKVWYQEDPGQWYNAYLTDPIGSLTAPDLDRDPVWDATRRAIETFLEADVTVPLMGLPTFASALNIAVNLYGQKILMEMLAEPEDAAADMQVINDLICELHRRCRAMVPRQQLQPVISWNRTQPPGYGQLCGCTTQLVSGGLYRSLIAPLDHALLAVYPHGGMIHLCGDHAQHIPVFRDMPALRAVQLNDRAAADLELYWSGLRDDQVIYLNPCPAMPAEKAVAITGGSRLIIAADIAAPIHRPCGVVDGMS